MQTISNTSPGNFGQDGVYIDQIPAPAPTPLGPQTNLVAVVGTANWGPTNSPQPFGNMQGASSIFGNNSSIPNAMLFDIQAAMPEGQNFLGVRVSDGTDTAATISLAASSGTAIIGTLTAKYTGAYPNPTTTASPNTGVGAYATISLLANSASASPQYQLAIVFPGFATETFYVNAYATAGGGYNAASFIANLAAAVNTGTGQQGVTGSLRWSFTAGTSAQTPQTATNFAASGGTNGTTTLVTGTFLGQNLATGRTGMYALSDQISAACFFIAGLTDFTAAATMAAFASNQNAIAVFGFQSLYPTASAQLAIANNNMVSGSLVNCMDWVNFYDEFTQTNRYMNPAAKIAGIISSLPPWIYPGNQPVAGANGVLNTDRTSSPITSGPGSEAQLRQGSNILYLTNNPNIFPRAVGYGLPFGTASNGTVLSDVRMLKTISQQLATAYGPNVGGGQGPLPASGQDTDAFRINQKDATDFVMQPYQQASNIVGYDFVDNNTNNTNAQIAQGYSFNSVAVQTLAPARYIVSFVQVGATVQFQITQAGQPQ